MSDDLVSVGSEGFKILPDGTVLVEDRKLKELVKKAQSENVSLEVMDAWLEVDVATRNT